ncbi:MAG: ATP-binding protein [candidate division Zixibacteria bacterium]
MESSRKPVKRNSSIGRTSGNPSRSASARKANSAGKAGKVRNGQVDRSKKKRKQPGTTTKADLAAKVEQLTTTNRQLKRKIFDLYTVFEISRNFNALLEYETLLDTFIFTCLGQVGALKGGIFLMKEVRSKYFHPMRLKGSGNMPSVDSHLEVNSSLAIYLAKINRPIPTTDLMGEMSSRTDREILTCFDPGIVVPLIYQTRLTGILALSDKISGRDFSLDDIEFLSIIGNQISVAFENARLYEGEREAINQLRAAQQQLLQTERLAALGEMSAKVAHEVNNPLGIIKNYLHLIRDDSDARTETVDNVKIVSEEIDRIAGIVRQLIDFHRPVSSETVPVDVVPILEDVLRLMNRQLASASVKVERSFPDEISAVMATPEGLKQVFLNLIINARDAMQDGGDLSIDVQPESGRLIISFTDTGPGIPPEIIARIFEPFFSTKEDRGGTGLGLSVCYGIIKTYRGTIRFENRKSGGRFIIELPLVVDSRDHDSQE